MMLLVLVSGARAQSPVEIAVGGGATEPTGDFGNAAKLGWHGLATVTVFPSGGVLGIQATGFYGQNNFDPGGGKWKLAAGLAELRLNMRTTAAFKPYFTAGGGVVNYKAALSSGPTASQTKGAVDGGLGVAYSAGGDGGIFLQLRYINVFASGSDLNFIPITIGAHFGF
jgi:hypothetical protein